MKYDWNKLEKEFILSDYKTVSSFLKAKGINRTGAVNKQVKNWKEKRAKKEQKKSKKTVEKIIEKEAEKEARKKVKVDDVANNLLQKIYEATNQLNKNTDMFGQVHENEIINRADIKKLTSALKDLADITKGNKENEQNKTPEIKISVIDNSNLEIELWRDFNVNKQ